jgi:signal transduction histidine kinase
VGSEDALRILFNNLIDNAIRYTPERGRVTTRVQREGSDVEVIVEDTGPGIPDEERERVFDRFYRGRSAGATGTGLGLAIVSQVADMHRGKVTLGTAAGGGLRVLVQLPAAGDGQGERSGNQGQPA